MILHPHDRGLVWEKMHRSENKEQSSHSNTASQNLIQKNTRIVGQLAQSFSQCLSMMGWFGWEFRKHCTNWS